MILAICINDTFKPNEIPDHKWIKKNRVYEIDWIGVIPSGDINVHLKRPRLGTESLPYTGFSHTRFRLSKSKNLREAENSVLEMLKELEFDPKNYE